MTFCCRCEFCLLYDPYHDTDHISIVTSIPVTAYKDEIYGLFDTEYMPSFELYDSKIRGECVFQTACEWFMQRFPGASVRAEDVCGFALRGSRAFVLIHLPVDTETVFRNGRDSNMEWLSLATSNARTYTVRGSALVTSLMRLPFLFIVTNVTWVREVGSSPLLPTAVPPHCEHLLWRMRKQGNSYIGRMVGDTFRLLYDYTTEGEGVVYPRR